MEIKKRNSSFELFRIITMFIIVASHYITLSGILPSITHDNLLQFKSVLAILVGWGGKTGINCFVLITGYFMCKSNITIRKFLKLLFEVEFYNVIIYISFVVFGVQKLSFGFLKAFIPFYGVGSSFTSSFLVFYLFIPFLNKLIHALNKTQHQKLIVLCLFFDTFLQTFLNVQNAFTYIGWFFVIYLCSSYIRLYPSKIFDNLKFWRNATILTTIASLMSVLLCVLISYFLNRTVYYWFVSDSNKIMAFLTAISAFLYFKNIKINYNPVINKIAASAFGVLLIHSNSALLCNWLWVQKLNNVYYFETKYFYFHMMFSIIAVYIVCTIIDMLRIQIIEKPCFSLYDKYNLETRLFKIINKFFK